MNSPTETPYSLFNDDMSVSIANKNQDTDEAVVQRMRHRTDQGVRFKFCGLVLQNFGATPADMQPFLEVTPSAMTELMH